MNLRSTIIALGCAAPVIGSYYIIPRHTLPFDFYDHYFIFIIIHLYNIFSNRQPASVLPVWLLKGFSILLLSTILASLSNPTAFNFSFFKQFLGALFSASSYFIVFRLANFNLLYLFKRYLNVTFYISLFAILEEVLHMIGIHITPEFPGAFGLMRVSGLSGEPYNFSLALFPAVFFYLSNIISDTKQLHEPRRVTAFKTTITFIAFFLTFSSTGYIGLFLAFIIIAIHKGYFNLKRPRVLLAPLFFGAVYFIFSSLTSSNRNFNTKLEDGLWFLQGEEKETHQLHRLSSSTFALLSNYYIAMEGFKENPIAGVGLGNYETLFNDKFPELFGLSFESRYGRSNYNDANSMFLRLIAETGIIGIALFFTFLIFFLIKKTYGKDPARFYYIVINHGIFILFLIRLLRCGNYLSDGMFFFVFFYYYTYTQFYQKKFTTIRSLLLQKLNGGKVIPSNEYGHQQSGAR